ncbi:MAG: DEAD/DEAH box helicase [Bacteroidia bacterium]
MNFNEFDLDEDLLDGLSSMGFTEATPVQELAIPTILENKDLIACAQTGTGKTAAYLLPILHKIAHGKNRKINTLVIAPTRELALQIDRQLEGFAYFVPVSSYPVYGGGDGKDFIQQKKALTKGADIIIATPGKLISHLNMGYADFSELEHLILDEADRMLDMGFHDDIMRILSHLPKERQTLLFSATMPGKIRTLSQKILKQPVEINIAMSKPAEGILQAAYLAYDEQKVRLIRNLLEGKSVEKVIIFSATKVMVNRMGRELKRHGLNAASISSDLEQAEREKVLQQFRGGKLNILVATDVLSRGIDIENIELIINFDVPMDAEDYIHRVGRTARAKATGVALTFINDNPKEQTRFRQIEELIGNEIRKLPLPGDMGVGPEYKPHSRKPGGGRKSPGQGKPRRKPQRS